MPNEAEAVGELLPDILRCLLPQGLQGVHKNCRTKTAGGRLSKQPSVSKYQAVVNIPNYVQWQLGLHEETLASLRPVMLSVRHCNVTQDGADLIANGRSSYLPEGAPQMTENGRVETQLAQWLQVVQSKCFH